MKLFKRVFTRSLELLFSKCSCINEAIWLKFCISTYVKLGYKKLIKFIKTLLTGLLHWIFFLRLFTAIFQSHRCNCRRQRLCYTYLTYLFNYFNGVCCRYTPISMSSLSSYLLPACQPASLPAFPTIKNAAAFKSFLARLITWNKICRKMSWNWRN